MVDRSSRRLFTIQRGWMSYRNVVYIILGSVVMLFILAKTELSLPFTSSPLFDFRSYHEYPVLEHAPLHQLCKDNTWRPNYYLQCEYRMGTFNAINRLQVCVRWAMDAGIGLITPVFTKRAANLTVIGELPTVSLDYLMDSKFIYESLKLNCPKMVIADVSELGEHNTVTTFSEKMLAIRKKGQYKQFIAKLSTNSTINPNLPTVILDKGDSLGNWDRNSDTHAFQFAFHNIFQFNPKLLEISNYILKYLPYNFVSLHLRLEKDWLIDRFELTPKDFLDAVSVRLKAAQTQTVYVASGDVELLHQFKSLAAQQGVRVLTKWDLVTKEEKEWMEKNLSFDDLALVDFEVLFHGTHFLGYAGSSFGVSLAQRRHLAQYGDFDFRQSKDVQQLLLGPAYLEIFLNRLWS